jgi:hypothetical protein
MEAICSSETSADFQQIARRSNHSCKNLRSFNCICYLYHDGSSLVNNVIIILAKTRNQTCFRGSATALHLAAAMAWLPEHTPPVAARAPSIHRGTAALLLDHRSQTRTSANIATVLTLPPPSLFPMHHKLVRLIRGSMCDISLHRTVKSNFSQIAFVCRTHAEVT